MATTRYYPDWVFSTRDASIIPPSEQSAVLPSGSLGPSSWITGPYYCSLRTTKTDSTQVRPSWNTLSQAGAQSTQFITAYLRLKGQTIPAGTWSWAMAVINDVTAVNTYYAASIYVWRPSTQTVVGYIYDADTSVGAEWPNVSAVSRTASISGNSVDTQNGDTLVVEFWANTTIDAGSEGTYGHYVYFDQSSAISDFSADDQNGLSSWIDAPEALQEYVTPPRTYYTTSSTGLSTTTSTTYVDKVGLTFTPKTNAKYAIFWSAVLSGSSITNFNNARLRKTTGTALTLQEFSIDRDEVLEESALVGLTIYTSSASPTEESFVVQYNTSVGTDTLGISDTYITALELLETDVYQNVLEVTSSNVNTYSSVNSILVPSGSWYIIGASTVNVNTTTMGSRGLTGIRIYNESTTTGSMEHDSWYPEAVNNFTAYFGVVTASITTPASYSLQIKDNSAGSSSLRERTLLALRQSDFIKPQYSVKEAETFSFLANVTQVNLTASLDGPYNCLVLGSWNTTPTNELSSQAQSNFRKDGVNLFTYAGQILAEGQTLYDLYQNGYAGVIPINNGALFDIRQGGNSALLSQSIKNASILLLPLSVADQVRRIRYVNTDSTAGGDGTTNDTTGATRAYASLSESIAAEKNAGSNLVTADEILEIRCSGTTVADTAAVEILGYTTSNRNYILITTGSSSQRAVSPWSTSRYRLSVAVGRTLTSYESVTIDGLQLENTSGTATNVIQLFDANSNETTVVRNCYLKADNATAINVGMSESSSFYAINNLISGSSLSNYGIYVAGDIAVLPNTKYYIYNNTFVGFEFEQLYVILDAADDRVVAKNNLFYRGYSTSQFTFRSASNSGSQTYENNASSDSRAPPNTSNGASLTSRTFTFNNLTTGDYHLSSSDVGARKLGARLNNESYYPFNTDMDLTRRGIFWDIGAFQTTVDGIGRYVTINPNVAGRTAQISSILVGKSASIANVR